MVSGVATGIRGARASASLKLQVLRHRFEKCQVHPRRTRLGLIEAPAPRATIELGGRHPRRVRLGLIEAPPGAACQNATPRHPRRTRLGLIEAPPGAACQNATPRHPRRTRLGLIEAFWQPSRFLW